MLEDIFRDKNNSLMINDLVSNVLGIEVVKIEFDCMKKFETISEYNFSCLKTKCDFGMEESVDLYFKIIKNNRIKESLFCYWCLLYEEKLKAKNLPITLKCSNFADLKLVKSHIRYIIHSAVIMPKLIPWEYSLYI